MRPFDYTHICIRASGRSCSPRGHDPSCIRLTLSLDSLLRIAGTRLRFTRFLFAAARSVRSFSRTGNTALNSIGRCCSFSLYTIYRDRILKEPSMRELRELCYGVLFYANSVRGFFLSRELKKNNLS